MGFAKNSIKSSSDHQTTVEEFEKAKSQAYKKALNNFKIVLTFVKALDNVSETQLKQIDNLFKRCQFNYSQKDYAGFDKNLVLLEAALLRLKGIITADNC